jgi:hypothetical protein
MSPSLRTLFVRLLYALGALLSFVGLSFVLIYLWEVISVIGEPDQSIVFWGLAILLIGIILFTVGATMVVTARRLLKKD